MWKRLVLAAALVGLVSTSAIGETSEVLKSFLAASGDCVWDRLAVRYCGPGKCVFDESRFARCAAEPGAGVSIDYYGDAVCGPGACLAEATGEVYCSVTKGGYAWYTTDGTVDCTTGCVLGMPQSCVDGVVDEPWRDQQKPMRVLHHDSPWGGPQMALRLSGEFPQADHINHCGGG